MVAPSTTGPAQAGHPPRQHQRIGGSHAPVAAARPIGGNACPAKVRSAVAFMRQPRSRLGPLSREASHPAATGKAHSRRLGSNVGHRTAPASIEVAGQIPSHDTRRNRTPAVGFCARPPAALCWAKPLTNHALAGRSSHFGLALGASRPRGARKNAKGQRGHADHRSRR